MDRPELRFAGTLHRLLEIQVEDRVILTIGSEERVVRRIVPLERVHILNILFDYHFNL